MNLDLQKVLPAEAFETEQNEGDYIGKDGLLYCGVCRTKKQTRLPASDFTGGREIIVPCICKCKVEENKRKEEEEKKRQEMQRLERLKASSLMDAKLKAARLDGYQVDGDNQKIYNLAGNYVKRFDEMYEKRQGLLFWGTVGTGKSYTAACIANELLDQMIPVVMTSFVKILQNIQGKSERTIKDTERKREEDLYCVFRIEKATEMYREECEKSGSEEAKRRYRELSMMYLDEKPYTVQEISEVENISDKTVYKDIGIACGIVAIYLLGADF